MRHFRDIENGTIISLEELQADYLRLVMEHGTEAETFGIYLNNCLTSSGGQLEEVHRVYQNIECGNILTYDKMVQEALEMYDLDPDDPTRLSNYDEFYVYIDGEPYC